MRQFVVESASGWKTEVGLKNLMNEDYRSMAFEAMTIVVERVFAGKEGAIGNELTQESVDYLGWMFFAYSKEKGCRPEFKIAAWLESLFQNANFHQLANKAKAERCSAYTPEELKREWSRHLNGQIDYTPQENNNWETYVLEDSSELFTIKAEDWGHALRNARYYKSKIVGVLYEPVEKNMAPSP